MTEPGPSSEFRTTQWTRVLQARGDSPEAKAALSDLCAAYYGPVFAFIRRAACNEDTARDLTQEFFARLLARPALDKVDPQRGHFRSFLLGAVKHFLADMRDHDQRLKRGADQPHQSIDPGTDTSPGLQVPDANAPSPEREFDRKWAHTVLGRSLTALAEEDKAAGKAEHGEARPVLAIFSGDLVDHLQDDLVITDVAFDDVFVAAAIAIPQDTYREDRA